MSAEILTLTARRNPNRPQHRGELRRSRLLAALADQLEVQSLADVSVASVADQAGLGRSAFYFYFSSKNEAVTHLLSNVFDEQIATAREVLGRDGNPRDNLSRVLYLTAESWTSQRRKFLAMLDARDADAETRDIWNAWLRRYENFVAAYIDEHRHHGTAASADLAHSLISLNERVLERHLRGHGLDSPEAVHAAMQHIWAAAIFGATA